MSFLSQEERDYAEDQAELSRSGKRREPPNSRIEFWALAVGYAVIGLSLGFAAAVLLQMAVQGEIQSFHLVDALSSLQRGVVGLFGVILVLSSLWSFRRAYRFATAQPDPPSDNTIHDE